MKEIKSSKAMDFIETNTFRFPGFEEAVISEEDAWKAVEIAKEELLDKVYNYLYHRLMNGKKLTSDLIDNMRKAMEE